MNKKDWFLVIALVPLVWAVDQLTKSWAVHNLSDLKFYGPIGLVLHHNPGAILGAFSDLPPILRVVSLSTGGAFLIFIYAAIQYLLPQRSITLRSGMSILLGGILGNVTDRIVIGSVVDFLLIGSSPQMTTPAFNFADAIQWVGYGMVVVSLIREGNQIWPNENERKRLWINPPFQLKYCFIMMFIGAGFAMISGVFAYTYLQITIDDIVVGPSRLVEQKFLIPFIETFLMISGGFVVMLFALGRILSHRVAGPLYSFERFLEDILNGKDRAFRLRAGDEFKHLEELANKLREQLKSNFNSVSPAAESDAKDVTPIRRRAQNDN